MLVGRIFDDRGNRMTPSHVRKGGIKYRYYLSAALLQGQPERAGSVSRVRAANFLGSPCLYPVLTRFRSAFDRLSTEVV